jgi:hypothetical protein
MSELKYCPLNLALKVKRKKHKGKTRVICPGFPLTGPEI